MLDETVVAALTTLRQPTQIDTVQLAGSMSQSGVYKVRINNLDAVLKVTSAGQEQDLARRELEFYQTLAADVPVQTPHSLDFVNLERRRATFPGRHPRSASGCMIGQHLGSGFCWVMRLRPEGPGPRLSRALA